MYIRLCDCKSSPYDDKLEGRYSFSGSHCLCNCLLDVVCNLEIVTLLRRRVLILSQHRANQAEANIGLTYQFAVTKTELSDSIPLLQPRCYEGFCCLP